MTDIGKVQRPVPEAEQDLVDQIMERLPQLLRLQQCIPQLVLVPRPRPVIEQEEFERGPIK